MNYFPFHIGDYLSATRHLSWEEDAAYRRLLDVYYLNEKPLPSEPRAVYRLVLASTESQRQSVDTVLNEFFESTPNGWINRRADGEIEAMRVKQQKQRDKANKRWQTQKSGTAPAMPWHEDADAVASESDADAMPPTPTPTPTPTPKPEKKKKAASLELPDWVPVQAWEAYMEVRKRLRCADTERALTMLINKLDELRSEGNDVEAMLEEATINSWKSVYPVKAKKPDMPELKPGSWDYCDWHTKHSDWWKKAGFDSAWDAHNNRCWHHNYEKFIKSTEVA